jgi:putative methionine-R-sulfoxide reductase with GAF domain
LAVLKDLLNHVAQVTGVNWLGMYQARTKADGEQVLVKLAYQGALSLPEFPLTPGWATRSNNSAVGLSGTARVINDVRAYVRAGGSYYTCDPKVLAEACLPLFTSGSREVIGIIDAEAWRKDFFTDDTLAPLLALCVLAPEWLP